MKTKGDSGNDVSQILGNKVDFVGADNPNVWPSCRSDGAGRSRVTIDSSPTEGVMELPFAQTDYEAIDNASDHHGGNYNVIALNRYTVEAAGGGIHLNSGGNINLMAGGGLLNLVGSACTTVSANIVKLHSTESVLVVGPSLYVKAEDIVFENTVKLAKNLVVNGSVSVLGELYVTHITGPINAYATSTAPALPVQFYPTARLGGWAAYTIVDAPRSESPVSSPFAPVTGFIRIRELMMDEMTYMKPHAYTNTHHHYSVHIGADLKTSTDEIWADAANLSANTTGTAKPNQPLGDSEENLKDGTMRNLAKAAGDTLSQAFEGVI